MSYLAQVSYTGDGSTTQYSITFPFLDSTHIKAFVDGVSNTAFTISSSTLTFNSAPANSAVIRIERQTPTDARLVDFTDGSVLTEAETSNLDIRTKTIFKDINFTFNPSGSNDFPDSLTSSVESSSSNNIDLNYELNQFDIGSVIDNQERLIQNFLKYRLPKISITSSALTNLHCPVTLRRESRSRWTIIILRRLSTRSPAHLCSVLNSK